MEVEPPVPDLGYFEGLVLLGLLVLWGIAMGPARPLFDAAILRLSQPDPAPEKPFRLGAALKALFQRLRRWWRP